MQVSVVVNGMCDNQITFISNTGEEESCFWHSDDEILLAAVDTLGFSDWERVSSTWFRNKKSPDECATRALELDLKPRKRKNRTEFGKPIKFGAEIIPHKRRRELEALEERRLFEKIRGADEIDLIHRAYIVGGTRSERILMLNGTREAVEIGEDVSVSFSSLVMEMKQVSAQDVEKSIRDGHRNIAPKRLPKAVAEMQESQVLSPPRRSVSSIADYSMSCAGEETAGNEHLLDLDSSEINNVLKDALEESLQLLSPTKNDLALDDTCLVDFVSPKMKNPIPWLPFPPRAIQGPILPKQFFLIR